MDTTLNEFRAITTTLGGSVHMFIREVCSQYDTTELPHEMAAHGRRETALSAKRSGTDAQEASKIRLTTNRK